MYICIYFILHSIAFYQENPGILDQLRHLLFSIPLCLAFVLIKYLYNNSLVDDFSFLFFDGILCIIIPLIIICIIVIFKGSNYFFNYVKSVSLLFEQKVVGKFFLVAIFSFGYHLANALTIYIYF